MNKNIIIILLVLSHILYFFTMKDKEKKAVNHIKLLAVEREDIEREIEVFSPTQTKYGDAHITGLTDSLHILNLLPYRMIPIDSSTNSLELLFLDNYKIIHCLNGDCKSFYDESLILEIIQDDVPEYKFSEEP